MWFFFIGIRVFYRIVLTFEYIFEWLKDTNLVPFFYFYMVVKMIDVDKMITIFKWKTSHAIFSLCYCEKY